jgi:hypothetical protein
VPTLHAKFLFWDSDTLAITSFNWMSTVVAGTRARGAEIGVVIRGLSIRGLFEEKLRQAMNTQEKVRDLATRPIE